MAELAVGFHGFRGMGDGGAAGEAGEPGHEVGGEDDVGLEGEVVGAVGD